MITEVKLPSPTQLPASVLNVDGYEVNTGPVWRKFTITHTQLQTAGLTNDIEIFLLAAREVILATKVKHSVQFAGTSITDYDITVGIAGTLTKYHSAVDVDSAVASTTVTVEANPGVEDEGSTVSIRIEATSVGANLDQSTAGSVDIWFLTALPPA